MKRYAVPVHIVTKALEAYKYTVSQKKDTTQPPTTI